MNVLVCSQQGEVQVEEVREKMLAAGINCVLFERYRKDHFITYDYKSKPKAILRLGEDEYSLDSETFPVVWYRPKPIILSELPGELGDVNERFCAHEWRIILKSMDTFLSNSKWVNPIWSSQRAGCKTYQLKLAAELGLITPATIITNDAKQAVTLFNGKRVIYKTLSSFLTAKQAIYTSEIALGDVVANQTEIAMAPGIFQQYIEKDYELRITIIGKQIFIARINSQLSSSGKVDWRRDPNPKLYELGELTNSTRQKLLDLHTKLGLIYATYDFVVDTDGNEIFLECNPSGQWLWLENMLNLTVSDMMIHEFLKWKDGVHA